MKQTFYFFEYLQKQFPLEYLDSIKFELDNKVYNYGNQFRYDYEKNTFSKYVRKLYSQAISFYRLLKVITFKNKKSNNYVVSAAYFGLESHLNSDTASMPWISSKICTWKQYKTLKSYQLYLLESNFIQLLSIKAISKYEEIMDVLRNIYGQDNIKYLCLPQDMSPLEKMSVKVFKELGKKSFVFLHGLPGRYNNIDDNRADYLVVWGEKIKDAYVSTGVDPNKIFISGHPRYGSYNIENIELRMGLENILVISKSMNGGQHSDGVRLTDRGNLILYLLKVQVVLRELGVSSVRFRPHPSENINWYYKYIDKEFFKMDSIGKIGESLKSSSLVIGPTSSVFLDSLMNGVNYLVFEPSVNNIDIINFPLVPPFDNMDRRVIVTRTDKELKEAIINMKLVDISVIKDYVQSNFDLSFLEKLI